ncbi:hypothetical protein [Poriferisphaera sp. WC338]|uniref:hypothetical protein n=1 Tax=Poriferisphaera sp. WC338 TaxID=3425129 RepID=UPI003D816CD3
MCHGFKTIALAGLVIAMTFAATQTQAAAIFTVYDEITPGGPTNTNININAAGDYLFTGTATRTPSSADFDNLVITIGAGLVADSAAYTITGGPDGNVEIKLNQSGSQEYYDPTTQTSTGNDVLDDLLLNGGGAPLGSFGTGTHDLRLGSGSAFNQEITYEFILTVIPEPTSTALLSLPILGLLLRRRH